MSRAKSGARIPAKDNCQTPKYAIDIILPYIPKKSVIWEPAAGEGILVTKLRQEGFKVVDTELSMNYSTSKRLLTTSQMNFLNPDPSHYKDVSKWMKRNKISYQVSNPPFSKKYEWLTVSYELGLPFFLLVPVETLGAATAQRLFKHFGITFIFLDKRINFKMPNKGWEYFNEEKGRMQKTLATFPTLWLWWDGTKKQRSIYADVKYTEPE